MNDGQAPKRSPLGRLIPYILMLTTIGLFVWLILSNTLNRSETWTVSQIDTYFGYSVNFDTGETATGRVVQVQDYSNLGKTSGTGAYAEGKKVVQIGVSRSY